MSGVGVRDDDIGADLLTALQRHACRAAIFHRDLINRFAQQNAPTLIAHDIRHSLGNRSNTAHGVVDAIGLLQIADQDVNRRDVEWITADEERVKGQGHTQAFILYPF